MSNLRPISSLPLSPNIRGKLLNAGYQTVKDLQETSPVALSKDLGISTEQSLNLIQKYKKIKIESLSAAEALERDIQRCPISTSCLAMDEMLGGCGVPIGKITEFCGAPGIGKTQLGMQLAVNVQIPKSLSGPGGEAIYIDTEGSFIAKRVQEIAISTVSSLNEHLKDSTDPLLDVNTILSKIHYFRVHEYVELLAVVKVLDDFLKEHPEVKLVVIDSIAFHFRQTFSDMALRTRLLNGLAQDLTKHAHKFQLAIVLMNQMTTRFGLNTGSLVTNQPALVPALGESWAHQCTNRVVLYWRDDIRYAHLVKSPNLEEQTVAYEITRHGVRDLSKTTNLSPSRKRPREEINEEEAGGDEIDT